MLLRMALLKKISLKKMMKKVEVLKPFFII